MSRPKALVAWSTGKDSAWALHVVRQRGDFEVVGLLTTVTSSFDRVSMHGVRKSLLQLQAEALELPCFNVEIPSPCSDEIYDQEMARALENARHREVEHVIFGDLFLEDIRKYREEKLAKVNMHAVFPLWNHETSLLSREIVSAGLRAVLTCVDPRKLDSSFGGRMYDSTFLDELPGDVDPCGENGEFHTFVTEGPMFARKIDVTVGDIVKRNGFVFTDIISKIDDLG
ncbi:MAG: adenine nucleotide alpha hydrolase [Proteobacteria bacterium]|nr:adenine nucleotide alpha hydrolase [Pseudomonadota bacterium]